MPADPSGRIDAVTPLQPSDPAMGASVTSSPDIPLMIWRDDASCATSCLPLDASHSDALLVTGMPEEVLVGRGLVPVFPGASDGTLVCVLGFCDAAWTTILTGTCPQSVTQVLHVRSDITGHQLQSALAAHCGRLAYCGMDLVDLDFIFDGMLLVPALPEVGKIGPRDNSPAFPISLQSALSGHPVCASVAGAIADVARACRASPLPLSLHRATPGLGTAASRWLAEAQWRPWLETAHDVDAVSS